MIISFPDISFFLIIGACKIFGDLSSPFILMPVEAFDGREGIQWIKKN